MQMRIFVLFGSLCLAAGAVARADRFEPPVSRRAFVEFPMRMGGWQGFQQPPFDEQILKTLGLTDYLSRAYVGADRVPIGLYVGYWGSQRQGETIHSPQNCLPGSGWLPVSQATITIPDPQHPGGPGLPVNRYLIQKGADRQLVLYWFQSHGRVVASEYWSKYYLVADAVRMNRSDGALVRITVPILKDTVEAERNAERAALQFAQDLLPQLAGFLPD